MIQAIGRKARTSCAIPATEDDEFYDVIFLVKNGQLTEEARELVECRMLYDWQLESFINFLLAPRIDRKHVRYRARVLENGDLVTTCGAVVDTISQWARARRAAEKRRAMQ